MSPVYFLLLVPAILYVIVVLPHICKHSFSASELLVVAVSTYAASIVAIFISLQSRYFALNYDILGNIALVGCLTLLVFRKTKNLFLSGLYAFFTVIIMMIANTVVTVPLRIVLHVTIDDMRNSFAIYVVMTILTIPALLIMSKFIGNHLHRSYAQLSSEAKKKFAIYGFTLSALTYVLSQINVFAYRVVEDRILLSSINIILISAIFFTAVIVLTAYSRSHQKLIEAEFRSQSFKELENHTQQLEAAYDEIRSNQHDHTTLLQSFRGFATGENQGDFRKYLDETLNHAEGTLRILNSSLDMLKSIHIPELKALLSVKFAYALSKGIQPEIDIIDPVSDIPIGRLELCRIVGIMVDNAIEELISRDYERKILKFGILLDGMEILIICSNSCENPPAPEDVFEKGYTTKGDGRGIGLYNLKNICKSCGNADVTAYSKENEFVLVVTVR